MSINEILKLPFSYLLKFWNKKFIVPLSRKTHEKERRYGRFWENQKISETFHSMKSLEIFSSISAVLSDFYRTRN